MGLERVIESGSGELPTWDAIAAAIATTGRSLAVRMIDNLPAFPDEVPSEPWQEVRVALPEGMMTFRRDGNRLRCLVWGNADAALQSVLDAVACALRGSP